MKKRGSYFDIRTPAFRPLWRRLLVVALSMVWAVVEYANGSPGWAMVFVAAGAWCAYQFFVVWDGAPDEDPVQKDGS
ncbi:hypothetical protein AB1M95_09390 [Sulfitobacter sp. LCG007]